MYDDPSRWWESQAPPKAARMSIRRAARLVLTSQRPRGIADLPVLTRVAYFLAAMLAVPAIFAPEVPLIVLAYAAPLAGVGYLIDRFALLLSHGGVRGLSDPREDRIARQNTRWRG